MGLGANLVRGSLLALGLGVAYVGVARPILDNFRSDATPIEHGYVSPKSLSIQGKKNGIGNLETYLTYKSGDETLSLPCMKGAGGPLCGSVDYWWQSIGSGQRSDLVVSEWPTIGNGLKRDIVGSELQTALDSLYGKTLTPTPALGYSQITSKK